MKLLFDHNLSPRLINRLAALYPNSEHLYQLGLDQADDTLVWTYAKDQGYTIVTKDADFNELSILRGFPPKVLWIRRGNCSTTDIETILRTLHPAIQAFGESDDLGILTLY